jgi:hypothetical protein
MEALKRRKPASGAEQKVPPRGGKLKQRFWPTKKSNLS